MAKHYDFMRVRKPSRPPSGMIRLFFDDVLNRLRYEYPDGTVSDIGSGGGGGAPSGAAGGDLGGTYPNPTVTQARGLRETSGPTTLTLGAVADGQMLVRSGTTIVGTAAGIDEDTLRARLAFGWF